MREKLTRHSASACLTMQEDGVLLVAMRGPLTADALMQFKRQIGLRYGAAIRGFVADYRGAALAVAGAELDAVLESEPTQSAIAMPAALVVTAQSVALFTGHCLRMADRGVLRRCFSEPAAALAWAQRHAARLQTR